MTAYEAAIARIATIDREMEALRLERRACVARAKHYAGSTIGEAERRATAAEVFQSHPLPTCCHYCGEPDQNGFCDACRKERGQ